MLVPGGRGGRALLCRVGLQWSAQPAPGATDPAGEESGHAEAGEKEAVGGLGPPGK